MRMIQYVFILRRRLHVHRSRGSLCVHSRFSTAHATIVSLRTSWTEREHLVVGLDRCAAAGTRLLFRRTLLSPLRLVVLSAISRVAMSLSILRSFCLGSATLRAAVQALGLGRRLRSAVPFCLSATAHASMIFLGAVWTERELCVICLNLVMALCASFLFWCAFLALLCRVVTRAIFGIAVRLFRRCRGIQ